MNASSPIAQARIPAASNITHAHLLAVVNTRIKALATETDVIRLCDVGCGDGRLLSYFATCLPILNPDVRFEFFGIDVSDSGVQSGGFFENTIATLRQVHHSDNWADRLHLMRSSDPWPFESEFLHVVTSNQVIEHVANHRLFMTEMYRTLAPGGIGVHLFPPKNNLVDGHIFMPLVHRIKRHDLLRGYIRFLSRLGIGSYPAHRREMGMSLHQYAEEHADYMTFMCNYATASEILSHAKHARLRGDFRNTLDFYLTKLRRSTKRNALYTYKERSALVEWLSFLFLKYVSSVTFCVEKRQIYNR